MKGVSCIITAAGKNRRMREDLHNKGKKIEHKLLLKIKEEPILTCTVKKALKTSLNECIVVLGHFMNELYPSLEVITDSRLKLIENPNVDVELSQTLLNGVLNAKCDYCLCLAGTNQQLPKKPCKISSIIY